MMEPVDPSRHAEPLFRLAEYLAGEPMGPEEVRRFGAELCAALDACARLGVVHGGVRMENIYVDQQGAFRLGGPALPGETADIRGGSFAPASEQYGGRPADEKADVYALGKLMYALLGGGAPSPGKPPVNGDEALKSVVLKAVAPDPAARFATASEMRLALLERRVVDIDLPGTMPDAAAGPGAPPPSPAAQATVFAPPAAYAPPPHPGPAPEAYAGYAPAQAQAAYAYGGPGYAPNAPAAKTRGKLGAGAVIGIVCGAAALVALAVFLTVFALRVKAYNDALALERAGKYAEAIAAFERLSPYRDSGARIDTLGLKLAETYLFKGDAVSAHTALNGVAFNALTQDQQTEFLYDRARVDFARGNYDDAFSGADALYAAPRGEELFAQPLSDFCAEWIAAHVDSEDAAALLIQYASSPRGLSLIERGVYQKAGALLDGGDPVGAKALFDALGAYEDAETKSTECVYRQARAALDSGDFDQAISLFKSIGSYEDAAYQADLSLYRRACRLVSEHSFANAFEDFATLRFASFQPDDSFVPGHAQDLYAAARELYAGGTYGSAQAGFMVLIEYGGSYERSEDYRTLCEFHYMGVAEGDKDALVPLIGFEDAAGMLLANFDIAWAFLEGKWSCSSGYLEFKSGSGLTYSLSAPDFGDLWDILDGTLYFYDSDDPTETQDAYRLTIISENEIQCYAFKNGKTYTLTRK